MRYIRRGIAALFAASVVLWVAVQMITVRGKDITPPVITGSGEDLEVSVNAGEEEMMAGLTASDNKDGNLTDKIRVGSHSKFIHTGDCEVQYYVFDSSYNVGQFTRRVVYTDYESPKFALSSPLIYEESTSVSLTSRVSAVDALDGDLSDKIKVVSSTINRSKEGTYSAKLEVTNEYGDVSTVELPVHIVAGGSLTEDVPKIVLDSYLIYIKKGEKLSPRNYLQKVIETDESEGNTDDVSVKSAVNTSEPGVYEVTYTYRGANGNDAVSYLVVIVTE